MAEKEQTTPEEVSSSTDVYSVNKPESKTAIASLSVGPRRSSSRSIKRPKFDDELVDTSGLKRSSSRKTSESSPSDAKVKKTLPKSSLSTKKRTKKVKTNPVPSDFGRWRPTDDLSLISAVTQTCDLQMVHLAVRFSCNFTLKEIQDRWFALLYDPLVSRLAQQSIKALPSDVINKIIQNVLWSRDEDCIIADVDTDSDPTLEDFQKLLDSNLDIFHQTRTASKLHNHWLLLRHYQLLNCQTARNVVSGNLQTNLLDMEAKIIDDQIIGAEDDTLNQELAYADRCQKREIRRLEKEIPQWSMLLENSGHTQALDISDFNDLDTLAILKGRVLKYSINSDKVTIGRSCMEFEVDIDLSLEGPALKISRRQGVLSHSDGRFKLLNSGRRPFYVNGIPLPFGASVFLLNNSVIEIHCIKLVFEINPLRSSIQSRGSVQEKAGESTET